MMRRIALSAFALFIVSLLPVKLFADTIPHRIIHQEIIYHTAKASEVIIAWAINDWQTPSKEEIPPGSYIKGGMVYTPMKMAGDSFKISIPLKEKTYLHYMFWLSKDKKGKPSINWDTFYGANYSLFAKNGNEPRIIKSIYDQPNVWGFNVFDKSWLLGIAGLIILFVSILFYFRKLKYIPPAYLLAGFLLASFIIMLLARLQMNKLYTTPYLLFGAGYYDLIFLSVFGAIGAFILFLVKNKLIRNGLSGFLLFLILITTIIALCNIEIVKQIGRPLNYQWLYYSEFMQSADAKNALNKNLSPDIIKSILLNLTGLIAAGTGFALFFYAGNFINKAKWKIILLPVIIMLIGFIQKSDNRLSKKNIENPISAFFSSWLNSGSVPRLFSMDVLPENRKYISDLHSQTIKNDSISFPGIKHIVLLVLESTPAEYISIYNKQFNVTPFLEKWQPFSRNFENMYAHVPATHNALFSLVSGVYPMLNYRSVVEEKPTFPTESIAGLMKRKGWTFSMFSAADLNFNKMGDYLLQQGFDTIRDVKNINCTEKEFVFNYSDMDGIDDKCLVEDYVKWLKAMKNEKTFSIVWTMQTHHPYSFNGKETEYTKGNADLNRYLNALHHADESFGYLMEQLKAENILNETLVIVIGDHGEAFGRHNQFTHASNIYEENLHIPCLVINPVLFKGEKDPRLAGLIDIPATIAKITGNNIPIEWQGRSLFDSEPKNQVFFYGPYSDFLFGTRKDNWKLIFNASTNSFELYDLSNDPQEANNLADKFPEIVNQEYQNIAAWVQYHNGKMKKWLE